MSLAILKLDPFEDNTSAKIDLAYPFWITPVKSTGSMLAYQIKNKQDLHAALDTIRQRISAIAKPFNLALSRQKLPRDIADINKRCCIVEALISGDLHTVEAYIIQGEVYVYGVIDSLSYDNSSSFLA